MRLFQYIPFLSAVPVCTKPDVARWSTLGWRFSRVPQPTFFPYHKGEMFSSFSYIRYDVTRVHNGVGWTRSSFTTYLLLKLQRLCGHSARLVSAVGEKKDFSASSNPGWGKFFLVLEARKFFFGPRGVWENGSESVVVVVLWMGARGGFVEKRSIELSLKPPQKYSLLGWYFLCSC